MLREGAERATVHPEQAAQVAGFFPKLAAKPLRLVQFEAAEQRVPGSDQPLRVGVSLSGGQAAGGCRCPCCCFLLLYCPCT